MNQNNVPTTEFLDAQTSFQQAPDVPPPDKQKSQRAERARQFVIILLFILFLFFHENPIITTLLALLGIGTFASLFDQILKWCEKLIMIPGKPLERLWASFFRTHLTSLGRWFKRHRRLVGEMTAIILAVIVAAITTLHPFVATEMGTVNDTICLHTSLTWFACSSGYAISNLPYNGVRIGLIGVGLNGDTTYGPFDQSASNQDEQHVEKLILGEDKQACTAQEKHITLITVTTLSRTVEDPQSGATLGLQNIYGYYLAQHSYNATHPGIRLCLAIANLGTPDTADQNSKLVQLHPEYYSMNQVMYQIAQLAHVDPNVYGIVGFPLSQQATEALDIRMRYPSLAHLMIISPTASTTRLSNTSNYLHMNAPNTIQGDAVAQVFCKSLLPKHPTAKIAILIDGKNAYSDDLALTFANGVSKVCPPGALSSSSPITYTNGDSETIIKAVDQAVTVDQANYIFFPGYDEDMDTVQSELHSALKNTTSQFLGILGGDGLNNVDATTHYAYYPVYASSFAQPLPKTDSFVQSYSSDSNESLKLYPYNACSVWMAKDMLLAIDAIQAFTQTLQVELGKPNPASFTQEDFNSILNSITFKGESGSIWFQGGGTSATSGHLSDRIEETIYIVDYDQDHNLNLLQAYKATIDTEQLTETALPHCT